MEYFKGIEKIKFEGNDSDNPLSFKYYDENKVVAGKTMKEHFRFAVAYWHTMKGSGADMFGWGNYNRPWEKGKNPMEIAEKTLDAAFEFFTKLGVPYYCFHDRDIAPEGSNFAESCSNLHKMTEKTKQLQKATGIKLLWGTANLFSNPRFTHGAGSNPDPHVFAYAASQVKNAMDVTKELGGENYVFWGGREGYETLLNTNYSQEQEQLARFFEMAVDYKKKIGFKGTLLIEPKPKEPTKHQYDFDAASILNFLRAFDLFDDFKLNIEANHATLAGHTFQHELTVASAAGRLGSIDANTGDTLLGWDTDQFLTNIYDAVYAMLVVLKQGGLGSGGFNFDAKLRRGSTDLSDLFHAHIGSMDAFAKGLLIADEIIKDKILDNFIEERYSGYKHGTGLKIMNREIDFIELEKWILQNNEPIIKSGKQEYLENIINTYLRKF
ncbi:MAG: xylose isomerase [Bacteroidales bacterium]|nr:xylose isomerase [Bacteroidales bacterium]